MELVNYLNIYAEVPPLPYYTTPGQQHPFPPSAQVPPSAQQQPVSYI